MEKKIIEDIKRVLVYFGAGLSDIETATDERQPMQDEIGDLLETLSKPENTVSIIDLENERLEWSFKTFAEATPISSLRKLESEIKEIEIDINMGVKNPEEYADALMCLLDSAGRYGITVQEILLAFQTKNKVNKNRIWTKNPDNSYSHIKINSNQ